jgi:exodeoxyribonuclease-5
MAFVPDESQEVALKGVAEFVESGREVARLFGHAGSGKTTLAKHAAALVGGPVRFGAYTGKAALVLGSKGCSPVTTLHSLIYKPAGDPGAQVEMLLADEERVRANEAGLSKSEVKAKLKEIKERLLVARREASNPGFVLNPDSKLIGSTLLVVDEVSMVDERMAMDLQSFGVPILALGDPFQLPPVGGGGYYTGDGVEPDWMLDTIHRQKEGGDVLDLAHKIRRGDESYKKQILVDLPKDGLKYAEENRQIIVGTNRRRWNYNLRIKSAFDFGDMGQVVVGEKIIVLANDPDRGVFNGQLLRVTGVSDGLREEEMSLRVKCDCGEPYSAPAVSESLSPVGLRVERKPECPVCGWVEKEMPFWKAGFEGMKAEEAFKTDRSFGRKRRAVYATYGYAITCHKSQGSQWKDVMVVDESFVFARDGKVMGRRWLYTAVTRASDSVVVVRS